MKVTLLGYRILDFIPKDSEKAVNGTKLFLAHSKRGVIGKIANPFFVPYEMLDIICIDMDKHLGQEVDAEFDSDGKLAGLTLLRDMVA